MGYIVTTKSGKPRNKWAAIASLILGILAAIGLLTFSIMTILLSIIGTLMGIVAIGLIRKNGKSV
ncbi:hypothetical protein [Alkalibacillus haloalkaliphilus]|uniref:hypothetical protein n=1 Tax=Alkalibacillus haloalkaliphilus TaxID=94136 RepID=UPI0002FAF564|nr:hypothetical protein [Alkalibacillus haloalkaliphilus]